MPQQLQLDLVVARWQELPLVLRYAAMLHLAWRVRVLVLLSRPRRREDRVRYGHWLRTGERQWVRV